MSKSLTRLQTEITDVWVELGRDPEKLKLKNKTEEDLKDGLEKLRAIRLSFKHLFSKEGNHNLAISILAEVFGEQQTETTDE